MPYSVSLTTWQQLSAEQRAAVRQLSISPQQVEYAGPTERAVALCEADQVGDIQGLAIFKGQQITGFLLLKRGAQAPEWAPAGAVTISGLRIDQTFQGQGIGTQALHAVKDWVQCHWPEVAQLILAVDEDNAAGIRAYLKAGWNDLGVRMLGRIGGERQMAMPLANSAQ
ncbi:MAG: GNAT family N-acetyltransferase [Pseudomonas sp.]|uniref:GNAT family N-acetyltransferase n=1 Tax=Pseudomonas sp. TaxID=306 RepID=UPI00339AC8D0